MTKYISIDTIKWALRHLKDSAHRLLVDFLVLKHEGLSPDQPITIRTMSTVPSATRLMGILKPDGNYVDDKHAFFNPFIFTWLHDGYPRSGTYSTLDRSKTFSEIVQIDPNTGLGMGLSFPPEYVTATQKKLRRAKDRALQVPIIAMACWALRYDPIPDDFAVEQLVRLFIEEYNLTDEEVAAFFFTESDPPSALFSDVQLDRQEVIDYLLHLQPIEVGLPTAASPEEETAVESLPEDLLDYLRGSLLLSESLLRQLVTLLRAGKHLILTGPPGTGKSTLAAKLANVSEKFAGQFDFPASAGHAFTTATADWTTFDTLGGYVPSATSSQLVFQEGLFLQSIRRNNWLVIDELNRADVDKAFGQLFTVLSGHSVTMPYQVDNKNIAIVVNRNASASGFDADTGTYTVGRDWRIIATMNTFDRNLLFQLSAAFVRRFAVVHVGIPAQDELLSWIETRDLPAGELDLISSLLSILSNVRPLGPAIWGDVVDYMEMRTKHSFGAGHIVSEEAAFTDAVIAYVLPQLDGLDREALESVKGQLVELLTSAEEVTRLEETFREIF